MSALLALALLVIASAPSAVMAQDRIVIAQTADAFAMDPIVNIGPPSYNIWGAIFEGLVEWGPSGKLVPVLAESYQRLNATTWEFKLRKDVTFQNGEPFNAAAVAYTVERIKTNPKARVGAGYMAQVSRVEVVDSHTVRFVTKAPYPILDKQLYAIAIVPPNYLRQVGDDEFNRRPAGTGPYRLVRWVKDDEAVLEAYPGYWRGAAKIKTVVYRPIPDDSVRVAALQTGEVDLITTVPTHIAEDLKKNPKFKMLSVPSARTVFLKINALADSPLKDVRVRRAANMAVNVDHVIKAILSGYGTKLDSELSPLIFGFSPDIKRYAYDPARARRLLGEAGYPNGFDTVINAHSGKFPKDREVTEAVAGFLNGVGIRAQIRIHDGIQLSKLLYAKKLPGFTLWTWGLPSLDADSWLRFSLHSQGLHAYYHDPTLDQLVERAGSEMDPKVREATYREALQIAREQAVHVPLYYQHDIYAARANVNFTPRSDEHIAPYDLSFKQ